MLRALYTAGTGMLTQRKRMDVVTNNLANMETSGFKKDTLVSRSFDDMMIQRVNDTRVAQAIPYVGPFNKGIYVDMVETEFEQGTLEQTDNNTDLALAGEGFFVVNTPQGELYTRASVYKVDPDGYLTNPDGYQLMGENGPLRILTENGVPTTAFGVNLQGEVQVNGRYVDRIRVVNFQDVDVLRKQGNNLFTTEGEAQLVASTAGVKQGFVEGTNIDISREMVNMMEISRNYESNQRIVRMLDDTLAKAVNDIGRV